MSRLDPAPARPRARRPRFGIVLLGTLAALALYRMLAGSDGAAPPLPVEEAGRSAPPPSAPPPMFRTAAPVASDDETDEGAARALQAPDGEHQARVETGGRLVYAAPGRRDLVLAQSGASAPVDIAMDERGVVHLAWFDGDARTIQYARVEPRDRKSEEISPQAIASARSVASLKLRIDRGVTVVYRGPEGDRVAAVD